MRGDEVLRKSIPLLGSDKDGEVLAAAQAIGRVLKGADVSWVEFASSVVKCLKFANDMTRLFAPVSFDPRELAHGFDRTGEHTLGGWVIYQHSAQRHLKDKNFARLPETWRADLRAFLKTQPHKMTDAERRMFGRIATRLSNWREKERKAEEDAHRQERRANQQRVIP
jgi:hypothetical protein